MDPTANLVQRKRRSQVWKLVFLATLFVSVAALIALLVSIINGAFGLTALEVTRQPADLVRSVGITNEIPLADLPSTDYLTILEANLTSGRGRVLEREQRFSDDRLLFEPAALFAE